MIRYLSPVLSFSVLLSLVPLFLTHAFAAEGKSDSKSLTNLLEKLEQAKDDYAELRRSTKQKVSESIEKMKQSVDAGSLPIQFKSQINSDLDAAKYAFEREQTFEKIPALQQVYRNYVIANVGGFNTLMEAYDKTIRKLPPGDERRQKLMKQVDQHREETSEFDSLKVGTKFVGYRCDFDWGPVRRIEYSSQVGALMLTKIKNDKVQVEFTFEVTKREGAFVEGIIAQNEGRFKAVVRGTYDGINLAIKMVRMKRGAERYFEYQGEVIGNLGLVALQGIKTNKVATTGRIFLERQ